MRAPDPRRASPAAGRELPWWTRPSALNLLFVLPLLVAVFWAAFSGPADFARSRNYLSAPYFALCIGLVLASSMGAWLGENVRQRTLLQSPDEHLARAAGAVGVVVLATYVFWYRSLVLDPPLLLSVLTGGTKPQRDEIGTVVGITSLVNLAPLFFSLAGYLLFVRKLRGAPLKALVVVLLLFTFFRAYVWSERLAVAEALVPLALAFFLGMQAPRPGQAVRRLLLRLGPYAALPAVFVFFSVAEYFRSWPFYQDRYTFWEFSTGRFVGYYSTSLNNGAGMLATTDWPTGTFEHVLTWLHAFPLGIGPRFSEALGLTDPAAAVFLERFADPEFTTPSAFASVTLDLGVAGALAYFFLAMFCGGLLFTRYLRGDPLGLMLYPSVLLAIFESFRYSYWGMSRAFVWFGGTVLVLALLWAFGAIAAARPARAGVRSASP